MPAKDLSSEESQVQGRPGRLRAAWLALMGHPVVPDAIRAEWAETQLVLHDMLTQLSASLARQARAEKKRIERLREQLQEESPDWRQPPQSPRERKAQLRRMALHGGAAPPPFQQSLNLNGQSDQEDEP